MPVPQEEAGFLGEGEGHSACPGPGGGPLHPQCLTAAKVVCTLDDSGRVIIIIGPSQDSAVFLCREIYLFKREMGGEGLRAGKMAVPAGQPWSSGTRLGPPLPAGVPEECLI